MTAIDRHQLADALRIGNFTERRDALRKLAQDALDGLAPDEIVSAFIRSPLIGTRPEQINPRPTRSGLRDSLTEPTLIVLAAWITRDSGEGGSAFGEALYDAFYRAGVAHPAQAVLRAIENPPAQGVADTRSRTGHEFGRHKNFTDTLITQIKDIVMATTTDPTKHDTTGFSAANLLQAHDGVMARIAKADLSHLLSSDDVLAALSNLVSEPHRIPGIRAMIEARGSAVYEDIHAGAAPESTVDRLITAITSHVTARVAEHSAPAAPVAETPVVDLAVKPILDAMLVTAKLPSIDALLGHMTKARELEAKVAELARRPAVSAAPLVEASHGPLPSGKVVMTPAWQAMGLKSPGAKTMLAFEVPVWEWDAPHAHVPAIDPDYVFRPAHLVAFLWAVNTNKKAWLSGHTGTGKSTLVEQICARLRWPVLRVNFDSEITRMDLVGRDVLTTDETGKTVSRFVDGILPTAMSGPYYLLLDEIDFVRPDVSYVLQRALEGQGMLITEDAGRLVRPHPWFRIAATGNTKGQGDEFGIYAGARPQSLAFINRFNCFIDVDYLPSAEEKKLVAARVPDLPADMLDRLMAYTAEHRKAFANGEVLQPLSPRGLVACAEALTAFARVFPKLTDAVRLALDTTLLNAASQQDRAVLKGLADRTFA